MESFVILQFILTLENSFTIFTVEFCSNIMLLFLVFLYLFYICAFLLTKFAIQNTDCYMLTLFYLTFVNNWISLNSVAMCLNSASGFYWNILAFLIWAVFGEHVSLTVTSKQLLWLQNLNIVSHFVPSS